MYESPFDMVMTPLSTIYEEVKKDIDSQIIESVLNATRAVNVTVDKEELLRALRYDRGQYDKGYADAKAEIVHCKDCQYGILDSEFPHQYFCKFKGDEWNNYDYFCGHAKRREVTTWFTIT
jgi:hypothetical protein